MKRPQWTHMKVRVATKQRLYSLAQRLTEAARMGRSDMRLSDQPAAGGNVGGVTLDDVINRLIDHYTDHLGRGSRRRPAATVSSEELLRLAAEADEAAGRGQGQPLPRDPQQEARQRALEELYDECQDALDAGMGEGGAP
jgi:hypothetical protein